MFKPEKLEEIPNFLTRYAECHVDELAAAEDVVFDAIRRIEAAEKVVDAARDLVPRMARELLSLRKWKKQILEDMKDLGMTFAECKIDDR